MAPIGLLTRARILPKSDHREGGPGWSDVAVAGALDVNPNTMLRVRRQFAAEELAVDECPPDPARRVVCLDETIRQLLVDARAPLPPSPAGPGWPISSWSPCHRGAGAIRVSERRTRRDVVRCLRSPVDVHYPAAERVVRILDVATGNKWWPRAFGLRPTGAQWHA